MSNYCYNCMSVCSEKICPKCGYEYKKSQYTHHITPGTVLHDRFLIGNAIGSGGFGITYIGRDLILDMVVAVKEYYPNGYVNRFSDASLDITVSGKKNTEFFELGKEKFRREARVLAKFPGNGNIVNVRDFFEENNTEYIVMEFVDGVTLSDYLKTNGIFNCKEIISRMIPLIKALGKVHNCNLIHRDISPDNIMILKDGTLKLMDFGAAREANFDDKKSLSIVLKPGYAPEEQYRSKGEQGPWTDIYALCATVYKCITGVTPDTATDRVFSDTLKKPSELGVEISEDLENAIIKGMALKSEDRFRNTDELLTALMPYYDKELISELKITTTSSEGDDGNDPTEEYREPSVNDAETDSEDTHTVKVDFQEKPQTLNKPKSKRGKKPLFIISGIVLCAAAAAVIIGILVNNKNNETVDTAYSSSTAEPKTTAVAETTAAEETTVDSSYAENYKSALEEYKVGNYEKAKSYFQNTDGYSDSQMYIALCDAMLAPDDTDAVVEKLMPYVGSDEVNDVILSDEYIYSFFKSTAWKGDESKGTSSDYYITFDENCTDDYNLPAFGYEDDDSSVSYYNFIDGTYTIFLTDGSSAEIWKISLESKDEAAFYCLDGENWLYLKRSSE